MGLRTELSESLFGLMSFQALYALQVAVNALGQLSA